MIRNPFTIPYCDITAIDSIVITLIVLFGLSVGAGLYHLLKDFILLVKRIIEE